MKTALSQASGRLLREALTTGEPNKAKDALVPVGYAGARAGLVETAVRERERRVWRGKAGRVMLVPAQLPRCCSWFSALVRSCAMCRRSARGSASEARCEVVERLLRRGRGYTCRFASTTAAASKLLPGARARVTESQGKKQVLLSRRAAPASRWRIALIRSGR